MTVNPTAATEGNPRSDEGKCRDAPIHANRHMRVICIGAGASGLCLAYKLGSKFTDFTLNIYEKNPDIGGTWYENRYPGCACDVPAHNYVYSFDPISTWSANYAKSAEIFEYFSAFADKYNLRKFIHCNHEVVGAKWDPVKSEWQVSVKSGDGSITEQSCDFLINASGILNAWRWPAIPGLQKFKGKLLHSAAWDDEVDVSNRTIGLIGNGSSGIQILPEMQKQAKHVTTFIREATWVSPTLGMEYRQYSKEDMEEFKSNPETLQKMRKQNEIATGALFAVLIEGSIQQQSSKEYIRQQMIEKINNDDLAAKLIPKFSLGCRRITPGTNYLESLTKENVTTLYGEITHVTESGCVMDDGKEYPVDVLICATGFDTTFKPRFPLVGIDNANLGEEWKDEPRSYLGLAATGFPNYLIFLGPNCPIGNGPVIITIEAQCEYMSRLMNRWQKEDIKYFDPKREAVDDFMYQKDLFMERTVWMSNCLSWYKNPVTNKMTAVWPGSTLHYMETLAVPRYDDFNVVYNGRRFAYLGGGFSQTEMNPSEDKAYYIRSSDDGQSLFKDLQSVHNAKDTSDLLTGPLLTNSS